MSEREQVRGDYLKHLMEDSHFTAEVTIATGNRHRDKMAVSSRTTGLLCEANTTYSFKKQHEEQYAMINISHHCCHVNS